MGETLFSIPRKGMRREKCCVWLGMPKRWCSTGRTECCHSGSSLITYKGLPGNRFPLWRGFIGVCWLCFVNYIDTACSCSQVMVTHCKVRAEKSEKRQNKENPQQGVCHSAASLCLILFHQSVLILVFRFSTTHSFQMQVQCFEGHFVMVLPRFRLFAIQGESMHSLQGK